MGGEHREPERGVEYDLTRTQVERILSIATLVKRLGMKAGVAAQLARTATQMASGAHVAKLPDDIQVFWRNPTLEGE